MRELATRVLGEALAALETEARQNGRLALFQALRAQLGAATVQDAARDGVEALALRRLRQRLRERVNARLRLLEPDTVQRRALRRLLYASFRQPE
jgi:hypothetical protein